MISCDRCHKPIDRRDLWTEALDTSGNHLVDLCASCVKAWEAAGRPGLRPQGVRH